MISDNTIRAGGERVFFTYPTGQSDNPVINIIDLEGFCREITQTEYSRWIDKNQTEINVKLGLTADGKEK